MFRTWGIIVSENHVVMMLLFRYVYIYIQYIFVSTPWFKRTVFSDPQAFERRYPETAISAPNTAGCETHKQRLETRDSWRKAWFETASPDTTVELHAFRLKSEQIYIDLSYVSTGEILPPASLNLLSSWRRSSHWKSLGQDKLLLMSGCQACFELQDDWSFNTHD